jgi:preprotein translocase subunit SecD
MDETRDLAIVLRAGSLPAPLKTLQNLTVGPSLGQDSIEAGKTAALIATLLVVAFMIFYYRLSGVIADMALVLNILLLFGAMASLNATLTLPGIAGIILAIGMAVDSNVLMFERMREEVRAGKTPRAAVEGGYKKAFWTIFDSHVTTLITAAVLFQFGTGPIKGFAVALSLGVSINLFTALIGTKTVYDIIQLKGEAKRLSI